jgi:transposase
MHGQSAKNYRRPAMFYCAIDQHAKQLTVNVRNEAGTVVLRRQVSTEPTKVRDFFTAFSQQAASEGGYMTILEVCGFNDWLIALLTEFGCQQTLLVQCEQRSKNKTDARDANHLGELLWINRHRIANGEKLQNLRRIQPPSSEDAAARQLTSLRKSLGEQRTRVLNRIASLLKKHNLQHACPTKGLQTKTAAKWLTTLSLPSIDRLEINQLLTRWQLLDQQIDEVTQHINQQRQTHRTAAIVATVPGLSGYAGLAIASRIGNIERFPRPSSLANFFGLTPSCCNSGESGQRLGSITKQGSEMVRFLLGQAVMHVLQKDAPLRQWYVGVKKRRGAKIARVGVMRRIITSIWHMLKFHEPYRPGGSPSRKAAGRRSKKELRAGSIPADVSSHRATTEGLIAAPLDTR